MVSSAHTFDVLLPNGYADLDLTELGRSRLGVLNYRTASLCLVGYVSLGIWSSYSRKGAWRICLGKRITNQKFFNFGCV